jgi:beta-ketoacyl-acyl-carrier-protein synthase II
MMQDKVVITGMGAITPIGHTLAESWNSAINGKSGLGPLTLFDTTDYLVKVACEVKDFDPTVYLSPTQARRRDRYEQFAYIAAKEALIDSGLEITEDNADQIGVVLTSSGGGLSSYAYVADVLREKGPRRVNPFTSAMYMSNGGAGMTSIDFGARGPSFSVASACASGGDGLGMAWLMIKTGLIDAAIAGASDALITKVSVASLDRSGAMCRRNGASIDAPRPFDLNRDGFVIGEGAAVMVLEREAFARARGAHIYGELAGYGSTSDAFHITAPLEDGRGAAKAMRRAMDAARVNLSEIDYISAHGTGTVLNDVSETIAIKSVFGEGSYELPVSATKSMTGHMVGVTPVVEAIFSLKTILEDIIPPTINYETPDPDCDLDYVPNTARKGNIRVALSNSFGFGGHNAVLVLKEYK